MSNRTVTRLGHIPDNWGIIRLRDGAEIGSGKSPVYKESGTGQYDVVGSNGKIGATDRVNFESGIAVGRVGASGAVHQIKKPVWLSDNVLFVKPHPSIWNESFLYHTLVKARLPALASQTAQPLLTQTELGAIVLPVPPLNEQIKIADTMNSVDEKIEQTENAITKTAQLRDALLHILLNPESNTHTHTHTPCWKELKLSDIAEIGFSSVDKKTIGGEIPVLLCNYHDVVGNYRIRSIINFMSATATVKEIDKWSLRQGDVIFTKDAEIGKVSLIEENIPNLICGYHLGRARPKLNFVTGPFLAELLKSPTTQRQFLRLQTGLTISGIRLDDTKSLRVCLPPLNKQKRIANILGSVDNAIEQTENTIVKTKLLRDALLHELLTQGLSGHQTRMSEYHGTV